MSPEQIHGSNMWQLFEDEFIEGVNERIEGPGVVRVFEITESDKLRIHAGKRKIEVEGTDFESVVQKK